MPFENADKLVVFLAAGDEAPGHVCLDLDGLGSTYTQVWAERLTGETPEDWMTIFGVADNAAVDESAEGETFALGVREAFDPDLSNGAVGVDLESAHEVIRLSFAKTADGAAEIADWARRQRHGSVRAGCLPDGPAELYLARG